MATRIQVRRDTAAAWTSANPTLRAGEIGFDTTNMRWKVGDGSTAWATLAYQVAGPTSATDNAVARFDGTTGRLLQNGTVTVDDNGRLTVATGATGGLAVGGPLHLTGTGPPEAVVTAPVGSTWTDTNATTGAIVWRKATGTGNTGWRVADADTGSRNMTGETPANGWALTVFQLRRINNIVYVNLNISAATASADTFYTMPAGFRPGATTYGLGNAAASASASRYFDITTAGVMRFVSRGTAGHALNVTFPTPDTWPATLPGS